MPPTTDRRSGRAARLAERRELAARCLGLFLRIRAVEPDPDGEHLLLWLAPKGEARTQRPEP